MFLVVKSVWKEDGEKENLRPHHHNRKHLFLWQSSSPPSHHFSWRSWFGNGIQLFIDTFTNIESILLQGCVYVFQEHTRQFFWYIFYFSVFLSLYRLRIDKRTQWKSFLINNLVLFVPLFFFPVPRFLNEYDIQNKWMNEWLLVCTHIFTSFAVYTSFQCCNNRYSLFFTFDGWYICCTLFLPLYHSFDSFSHLQSSTHKYTKRKESGV